MMEEKQNKDRTIGVRITSDMETYLKAFMEAKGYSYSKTMRLALDHYVKYVIDKEESVKQQENSITSKGSNS